MKETSKKKAKTDEKVKQKFYEEIVASVMADFEKRRLDRVKFERQWELNMNYLSGNQYCDINDRYEIVNSNKNYYWQEMEVFNHIAPLIESRLAKFNRVSPIISVKPKTENDKDVDNAFVAEKLIESAFSRTNFENVVKKVTNWSEVCGTGFYKVIWDNYGGNKLGNYNGEDVYEGEVKILPVSPFEIYPDNYATENIQDLQSIIHARAVSTDEVMQKYGVKLGGEDINVFNVTFRNLPLNGKIDISAVVKNSVVVIEKYERPSEEFPYGRLITVAGGKLLYYGELPYYKGKNEYVYPFVKQESQHVSGCFYGTSIIERLIPVQRAYNAVKNRKHEFINRLSMGIIFRRLLQ